MLRLLTTLLIFTSIATAAPFVTASFSKGKDLAEGHQLPIALLFTGSDWSQESQDLIQEAFKEPLQLGMILVQVDFPEINHQDEVILRQNHDLREKYQIDHFPTVVLLDSEENEVTRLGYPIEGVCDFAGYLKGIGRRHFLLQKRFAEAKKKKALGELKLCFEEAKALGSTALTQEIINEGAGEIPELMLEKYITLRGTEEGVALRLKLEKIGNNEIDSRLALLDFQEEASIKPLEAFIEKFGQQTGDYTVQMQLIISEFLKNPEEK